MQKLYSHTNENSSFAVISMSLVMGFIFYFFLAALFMCNGLLLHDMGIVEQGLGQRSKHVDWRSTSFLLQGGAPVYASFAGESYTKLNIASGETLSQYKGDQ